MANSELIILNKFVTKARKCLGQISIKSLAEERDYAIKIILLALFQNDQALETYALECAKVAKLESDWLIASQKFEQAYPINSSKRDQLREAIIFLVQNLMHRPIGSRQYRDVLQSLLITTLDSNRAFYTQLGRDFYTVVVKPLTYQKTANVSGKLAELPSGESSALMDLWSQIDNQQFNAQEKRAIQDYQDSLIQVDIKSKQIQLRIQLSKVLLVALKKYGTDKSHLFYRQAVDEIKDGIASPVLNEQFLLVSRQFHSHWKSV